LVAVYAAFGMSEAEFDLLCRCGAGEPHAGSRPTWRHHGDDGRLTKRIDGWKPAG
jgi:hypothetical protein